jgi:hypothetical protein
MFSLGTLAPSAYVQWTDQVSPFIKISTTKVKIDKQWISYKTFSNSLTSAIRPLESKTLTGNSTVNITCNFLGTDKPDSITWLLNDSPISEDNSDPFTIQPEYFDRRLRSVTRIIFLDWVIFRVVLIFTIIKPLYPWWYWINISFETNLRIWVTQTLKGPSPFKFEWDEP